MKTLGRIIKNPIDVKQGAAWLAQQEPRFAAVLEQTGALPLRLRPQGFKAMLEIIVSQQVSVASADAIRKRMENLGLFDAQAVLDAGDERLRAAGLSRPKVRYAQALAEAAIDFSALRQLSNDAVVARLCEVKGIGPWSAQIYVMFAMGRADGFAPGDLALQEAAKVLFELPERPTAEKLADMAKDWSPWRSVAARALFAYYRVIKQREGLG